MESRRSFLKKSLYSGAALSATGLLSVCSGRKKPNVLFIICDDLNDMVEGMGGHPQVKTPNIKRLMNKGKTFLNAHCNSPLCAPSRASMLSGLYPHTSGYYRIRNNEGDYLDWWDYPVLKQSHTMMQHFKNYGYHVMGAGKIFHQHEEDYSHFHEYGPKHSWGPYPWDGKTEKTGWGGAESYPGNYGSFSIDANYARLSNIPEILPDPEKGIPGYKGWRLYGKPFKYNGPDDRDLMPDELNAKWAGEKLAKQYDKPFLMMVGINRPHAAAFRAR
ncbi:MAG: sulfatase-like hydrolase/transferase [candidate division KSB1 bacterium]|nr:sulfatase-like hydrolase/transferase [candidate division KSB1 bacterium]